jgi:hypothetical protein
MGTAEERSRLDWANPILDFINVSKWNIHVIKEGVSSFD